MENWTIVISAAGGALLVVIGGVGAQIVNVINARARVQAVARAESNAEWKSVAEVLQKRVDLLEAQHGDCERRGAEQQIEIGSLRAELTYLKQQLQQQLQAKT